MSLLRDDLLSMGTAVEKQIEMSVDALKRRDFLEAEQIAARDSEIDHMRYELEERCIGLLATQNPLAGDLRTVTSALIVANELERMGDYAEGICKLTVKMAGEPP
ncbi:MAG: phosphate signaling complex PhoU family protein, partial [Chloroflexota bacterium]